MSETDRSNEEMRCVYMGPPMKKNLLASLKERLGSRMPEKKPYPASFADEKDPNEEPVLEEVYMGPPLDEEPDAETVPGPVPEPEPAPDPAPDMKASFDPRAMEGVYAGPVLPDFPPMAPVYAGPEMMNDPRRDPRKRAQEGPRMEALYAAPRRPDASQMMMVYAGPDYFADKSAQTPMMTAYARPCMGMSMALAAAQKEAEERDKNECGAQLSDSRMAKCPCCGSIVPKAKFCSECGAVFPKEEESASSTAEESGSEA